MKLILENWRKYLNENEEPEEEEPKEEPEEDSRHMEDKIVETVLTLDPDNIEMARHFAQSLEDPDKLDYILNKIYTETASGQGKSERGSERALVWPKGQVRHGHRQRLPPPGEMDESRRKFITDLSVLAFLTGKEFSNVDRGTNFTGTLARKIQKEWSPYFAYAEHFMKQLRPNLDEPVSGAPSWAIEARKALHILYSKLIVPSADILRLTDNEYTVSGIRTPPNLALLRSMVVEVWKKIWNESSSPNELSHEEAKQLKPTKGKLP